MSDPAHASDLGATPAAQLPPIGHRAPSDAPGADPASPRILVVDADDRTRESIVGILGIRHRYRVVGSAGHVGAALAIVNRDRPDVVIVDPRLPELPDGIALIRRVRAIDPAIRILAVGWTPSLEHDTIAAGADGFVRKTFKPGDLSGAISRCMTARTAPSDAPDPTAVGDPPGAGDRVGPGDPGAPGDPVPRPTRVPNPATAPSVPSGADGAPSPQE